MEVIVIHVNQAFGELPAKTNAHKTVTNAIDIQVVVPPPTAEKVTTDQTVRTGVIFPAVKNVPITAIVKNVNTAIGDLDVLFAAVYSVTFVII